MAKKNVKAANTNRAKKIAEHKRKTEERAQDEGALRSAYRAGEGAVILQDLKTKIKAWMALNTQVAQDGVGARPTGYKLADGTQEIENIYFTPEQRVTYLDKNAGMQNILDYIDRKLGDMPEPVQAPAEAEPEAEEPAPAPKKA